MFRRLDMLFAHKYLVCMPNLQVRNVPAALHRALKSKAALEGRSLRRLDRTERVTARRSEQMLEDLGELAIARYDHEILRPAMWRLRNDLTMYDAAYVALAELIGARIVTCDARLAQSTGHGAAFHLFDRSCPANPSRPGSSA